MAIEQAHENRDHAAAMLVDQPLHLAIALLAPLAVSLALASINSLSKRDFASRTSFHMWRPI
jgi:hypothetical protein